MAEQKLRDAVSREQIPDRKEGKKGKRPPEDYNAMMNQREADRIRARELEERFKNYNPEVQLHYRDKG